jgi:1-acyl-sn-glycerol-3-phosphate acyltransferase
MEDEARRTLLALGVGLRRYGPTPPRDEPLLVVANHVSWLDVQVLSAGRGARFVAKSETRHWPVVGTVTQAFDAIFIVRGSFRSAARTKDAVAAALRAGERVVVFPEATTTDGTTVGRFYPAMFQAAIDAGVRVLPVALRYVNEAGRPSSAAAFIDDMTFGGSLARVIAEPALRAEVHFGVPIASLGRTRRELAADARETIARTLALAPVHSHSTLSRPAPRPATLAAVR